MCCSTLCKHALYFDAGEREAAASTLNTHFHDNAAQEETVQPCGIINPCLLHA